MGSPLVWWLERDTRSSKKYAGDEMVTEMPKIVTKIVTKGPKCTKW